MYQKVDGNKDLVRDASTKAIINTNRDQYLNYIAQKKAKQQQQQEIEDLKSKVSEIDFKLNKILDIITGESK